MRIHYQQNTLKAVVRGISVLLTDKVIIEISLLWGCVGWWEINTPFNAFRKLIARSLLRPWRVGNFID